MIANCYRAEKICVYALKSGFCSFLSNRLKNEPKNACPVNSLRSNNTGRLPALGNGYFQFSNIGGTRNYRKEIKKVTKLPIVVPMRKLLNLLVLLTLSGPAFSQMLVDTDTLYGNEWINYDQSYYKIPVAKDGLYRLNAETLQQAGIVLSELSGDRLRLYHMGQEVPIHVSSAGSIAAGDYLLFWGKQNRGEFDTHLFEDPEENQLNPLYSLVTDTSAYYLTWGDAASSARLQTLDSDLTNPPAKEEWIWQQTGEVFTEKFMKNYTRRSGITIYFSHYDVAEGYGNRNINELLQSGSTTQDFSLDLPDAYTGGPSARFTARFGVGEGGSSPASANRRRHLLRAFLQRYFGKGT